MKRDSADPAVDGQSDTTFNPLKTKSESTFPSKFPDFRHSFARLASCQKHRAAETYVVCRIRRITLTGEKQSTGTKTCPSVTLSTINLTWAELESKPGLPGEKPATNRLRHGTAFEGKEIEREVKSK